MEKNWFEKLFINEAKAALSSRSPSGSSGGGSTEEGWIGDGNTHIWISLAEGRTSPMLGVCPNGTVTVDWGDGTTPDVLTGTSVSTVKWTPTHEYASAGDYVITLTVDGSMGLYGESGAYRYAAILRHTNGGDSRNSAYQVAVKKIELGNGVTSIVDHAFYYCYSLASITIPEGVTRIGNYACAYCANLTSITIPDSVTSIGDNAFFGCNALTFITIPDGVTRIGNLAFYGCYTLASITIPNSVTSIGSRAFYSCFALTSVTIPDGVTSIDSDAFGSCSGIRYYDFTKHTAVPTLSSTSAFSGISDDCEIRVPAALYDEWIAATNWTTYASNIVAV